MTDALDDARRELLEGLREVPKRIHPKFFYDTHGSELFEQISVLEAYYPTRAENEIYERYSADIARALGPGCVVIEPGAGSCAKIRPLLAALADAAYVPVDISAEFLRRAAGELTAAHPEVQIEPVVADFLTDFELPAIVEGRRRVLFYPGSTIGNCTPDEAIEFLARMRALVGDGGALLIGVDRHKDEAILHRAYNDEQGVTAAFNRNVLVHAGRILGADLRPDNFEHVAFYDSEKRRIEMHLRCRRGFEVPIAGERVRFADDELVFTEYSYKYEPGDFEAILRDAGFATQTHWTDSAALFSVHHGTAGNLS